MTSDFEPDPTRARLYPEVAAGGYTRHDGFVEFFSRVNALLGSESVVLDFGAGRGAWADSDGVHLSPYHRSLRDLRARGHRVIGVDVDDVVLKNPSVDEAHVVAPGESLPLADESVDVVVADHVLEHVTSDDAPAIAADLGRVLKPGGWLAARTPNKWGLIGLGARAVPNELHARVLRRLQPGRQVQDIFPTQYAMNTRSDLRRLFSSPRWDLHVYGHASEPQYVGDHPTAWRAAAFVDRITPPRLLPTLMVFAQRR